MEREGDGSCFRGITQWLLSLYQEKVSKRQQENAELLKAIEAIFVKSRQTYGSPRIHATLLAQGFRCSRPRVARLMKQVGIAAKMRRLFKRTTRVDNKALAAPNLLQQDFTALQPNQKWVSDISYVRTLEGWLYVAVVLDLFSRKVVGLSMGESLQTSLVLQALQQACHRRQPQAGLLHHSDKGCQYTSNAFQTLLKQQDIVCSMSGTGNCFDNAAMESFFHTLKTECVYFERYETRAQAKASIFEYVEMFYNNERRHSTLGYLSPGDFEQRYYQQ
jgi:putative transposase